VYNLEFGEKAMKPTASCAPSLKARYSDSVEDRDTVSCFLLCQLMGPPASVKTYAPMERRVSGQEPQSALVKPETLIDAPAL
jgi:hypothetical protein